MAVVSFSLSYFPSSLFIQQTTERKFLVKNLASNPRPNKTKLPNRLGKKLASAQFGHSMKNEDVFMKKPYLEMEMKHFAQREDLNEENTPNGEKPWWYGLQYVLGIFLSGAENNDAPKGLYSMKITPNSRNGASVSYAVAFEGQDDAKKFCYLLDSFFEGLDDVSADIAPLPVQDIKEAVESNELHMIVVPKGKIKLYVGQTLKEVEIAFRSLVDEI